MEPTSKAPAPGENYDFILDPEKQKKGPALSFGKDLFITKIIFLAGGAVVLIIVLAVAINLLFSSSNSVGTVISLAQRQQEIVRVSELGGDAISQEVRNAAINTQVSVQSHQQKSLNYLARHDTKPNADELNLKKDGSTDNKLKTAAQRSSFDTTYITIMRSQLTTYATELKNAYDNESSKTQRVVLGRQYADVKLLLEQWPENESYSVTSR